MAGSRLSSRLFGRSSCRLLNSSGGSPCYRLFGSTGRGCRSGLYDGLVGGTGGRPSNRRIEGTGRELRSDALGPDGPSNSIRVRCERRLGQGALGDRDCSDARSRGLSNRSAGCLGSLHGVDNSDGVLL